MLAESLVKISFFLDTCPFGIYSKGSVHFTSSAVSVTIRLVTDVVKVNFFWLVAR